MSHLPIPIAVLYAGLGGTVLALIVATVTNRWSPRVFFLLALRLAIGWHFLFEGLYKVQTYYDGPTETSKPFTSEPYFKVAPGPLGAKMRKEFSDPAAEIASKVKAPDGMSPADFASKTAEFDNELKAIDEEEGSALRAAKAPAEKDAAKAKAAKAREDVREKRDAFQAQHCPQKVAELIDANDMLEKVKAAIKKEVETEPGDIKKAEEKAIKDAKDTEAAALKAATESGWSDKDKEAITKDSEKAQATAKTNAEKARAESKEKGENIDKLAAQRIVAAKAAYARWVYGLDPRGATVKFMSGEVMLTAPQRIEHLAWVQQQAKAIEGRQSNGLGTGTGTDAKNVAEFRIGAITAESDLARDANTFIADLKKDLNGGKAVEETPEPSRGQRLDRFTMWFLVAVGTLIIAGLFTRVACVLAAGFLVMTYLTHPAFPWYPQPPNTEGNPLFINKNVIEAIALLLIAMYPSGRWLGLDAIVLRPLCKYKGYQSEAPVA
jgi:uncharacterized membrane protein YphA (DoxX/SURF4 family)